MEITAGSLFASLLVSTVGFGFFLYGKKQARVPQLAIGVVMMVYPYFVPGALWMLLVFGVLIAALVLAVRAGW